MTTQPTANLPAEVREAAVTEAIHEASTLTYADSRKLAKAALAALAPLWPSPLSTQQAEAAAREQRPGDAPNEIWLQWNGDQEPDDSVEPHEVSWCQSKIFAHDVRYIKADAAMRSHPTAATKKDAYKSMPPLTEEQRESISKITLTEQAEGGL